MLCQWRCNYSNPDSFSWLDLASSVTVAPMCLNCLATSSISPPSSIYCYILVGSDPHHLSFSALMHMPNLFASSLLTWQLDQSSFACHQIYTISEAYVGNRHTPNVSLIIMYSRINKELIFIILPFHKSSPGVSTYPMTTYIDLLFMDLCY